jgi:phage recombination protein Bet
MEGEMGNELAVQKENRLAAPAPEFSNDQIRLLGETVAKGCDQNELAFFLHVAKLKRLDPFTGQIHVVKRWDSALGKEKMTVQTGVDGYRVIAARTNDLAGIDDPEYDTESEEHPNVAKVTVYRYGRNDERIPYRATARWTEYAQTKKDGSLGPMWKKLPYLMLGKCAEALALRKAFPDELSGMYTNEEMDQAENEAPAQQSGKKPVQQPTRASEKKAEPQSTQPTQQAAQTGQQVQQSGSTSQAPGDTVICGIIETVKPGKDGVIWLSLNNGFIACVGEKHIDSDMKTGYFIKFRGAVQKRGSVDFYTFLGLIELSAVEEGEVQQPDKNDKNAPLAPDAQQVASEMFGEKPVGGQAAVAELVKNGDLKPASALPGAQPKKKGTIGKGRRLRLLGLCNTNKKENNGFNYDEIKKILAALPAPVEHIEHMEEGLYPQFEKWATGEEDWREFWKE